MADLTAQGLNLAAAANILKEDYEGPVREYLNNATPLMKYVKRNTHDFVGKELYIPVKKGRNCGTGSRVEGAALPTAGKQQYDKLIYNPKSLYARITLTGQAISSAKSSAGSFVRAISSEVEGAMNDVKKQANRQMWHDGSACLTKCGTTTGSATVVVESTKFLKPLIGGYVDVIQLSDGAVGTTGAFNRTIDAVLSDTTWTISGAAITTSALHGVFVHEARRSATSTVTGVWGTSCYEMWGLEALISDTDSTGTAITNYIGGVTRTGTTWFDANMLGNSGVVRPLTLDLMQQAFDLCEIERDSSPGIILTNHALKRRYASLLIADKRYPPGGEITLDGGYRALEFNGIPLVADPDASLTLTPQKLERMYFISLPSLEIAQLEDFGWMDRDGSTLKAVAGYDAYEAVLFAYLELCINDPGKNCCLYDLDEAA